MRKSEDKGKSKNAPPGKGKVAPPPRKAPPPGRGKYAPPPGKRFGLFGKGKHPAISGKKSSKKKKGHSIYSELQLNSSGEDNASKLRDKDFALTSDLGWDPTAYYPEGSHPPKLSKHIDLRGELSSPMMLQAEDCKFFWQCFCLRI